MVELEDLSEFFGGEDRIRASLEHMLGMDRGLNSDIDLPVNLFDLDDIAQFLMRVFWHGMGISTRCRHYPVGRPTSFGTRVGGPCRNCLAEDGWSSLVRSLDELDSLEACAVKTLSSATC
jgi:hypothetical protein